MKLDDKGYNNLLETEGLRLNPYLDTQGIPTIAVGNTYYLDGRKVKITDPPMQKKDAIALYTHTADKFAAKVDKLIISAVNQNQFNACVHMAYNIGLGGFETSTVLKLINKNPNDPKIADAIMMWIKDRELIPRRIREMKYYFDYPNSCKEVINSLAEKNMKLYNDFINNK